MNLRDLLRKRARLIRQAREIVEAAEGEDRGLTQEETNNYDEVMDEVAELTTRVERMQRQLELDQELGQPLDEAHPPEPGDEGQGDDGDGRTAIEFVSRSMREMDQAEIAPLMRYEEPGYRAGFANWLRRGRMSQEVRALQADSDTLGGYLYAPMQFVDRLIQAVDDMVFIRQWATVIAVTNGESLGVPSLDADPADPIWTSELATGDEDSTMAFGQRELNPHPLAKRIKVSNKLLMKVPGAEALVRARLAYKFGIAFEKALMTGHGAGQPLGVFTASDDGISTSRDASTGNTTTEIRFDGLIEAKYTLKGNYWARARWLFHRDAMKLIAKLKDGNGQYLWRESVRVGEPDRVLGLPVFMSEYAPNTFTTGLYVGIVGDFSNYWIADSLMVTVQRLVELYAATNQIGLIGRLESDGMPVLDEAFVRVTLA